MVVRAKRRRADAPLWLIYGLLLGPVGFLVIFNYVPAVSALYHAFTAWDIGAESRWVGLSNFRELARDPVFLKSLANLGKLGAFIFVTGMTIPFVVAELIFHIQSERWNYLCRVLVVLPMMVPGVVVYMLWKHIYGDAGIPTEILTNFGLHDWVYGWLSHPKTALWAVAFVGFPFVHGFTVLVYYAGLANIPASVLEAAELDGLGGVGRVLRIHIPLILQQVKLLVVVTVIGIVNGFESIYILTLDGGPGYETMVPGLYMYLNGFTFQRMGYACAVGMLLLAFLLLFTVSLNRLMRVDQYEPGK
jgi:raffinose/stachyose/melibiose transport system permease protein